MIRFVTKTLTPGDDSGPQNDPSDNFSSTPQLGDIPEFPERQELPFPHDLEAEACQNFKAGVEQMLGKYNNAITQCCDDADTPCFYGRSVRSILEDYALYGCREVIDMYEEGMSPKIINNFLNRGKAYVENELEGMLSNCFHGGIPQG